MPRKPQPLEPFLNKLKDYYAQCRALPTFEEMKALFGVTSKSTVSLFVDRLLDAGYLENTCNNKIAPTRRFFQLPIPGSVRAGFPDRAEEAVSDVVGIEEYLVEKPSATVLITVKGDSMLGACIKDGDILVVERRTSANLDDIVVAIIDNEFTVKTLKKDKKKGFYLHPENAEYPDIWPEGQLEIFGVMIGLMRKQAGRIKQ